jgi:hypothetical protein
VNDRDISSRGGARCNVAGGLPSDCVIIFVLLGERSCGHAAAIDQGLSALFWLQVVILEPCMTAATHPSCVVDPPGGRWDLDLDLLAKERLLAKS